MLGFEQDLDIDVEVEIDTKGGASNDMFPAVEKWLLESSDNREALDSVVDKADLKHFRSLVDYLVCAIYSEHRQQCLKFYAGRGPHLKQMIDDEKRKQMEVVMLRALAYSALLWEAANQGIPVEHNWLMMARAMRAAS